MSARVTTPEQKYWEAHNAARDYTSGAVDQVWNDLYLAGLFRNGLMLTTHEGYMLMDDPRYPDHKPIRAPRPANGEDLWPPETWIIWRD